MKWLRTLFPRGRASASTAETWRAGDVAECIHDGPWFLGGIGPATYGPRRGDRAIVLEVVAFPEAHWLGLRLTGWGKRPYAAVVFRKIVPIAADRTVAASAAPPAGSGSRPDATPLPAPAEPALEPAGEVTLMPETSRD